MHKSEHTNDWVDRYVRDELTLQEATDFEQAMLDSFELQQQLETALAIQRAHQLHAAIQNTGAAEVQQKPGSHSQWQPLAMAASVVLAVFSTTMYWKVSSDKGLLQSEITALSQPHGAVLTVRVNIMRSAGEEIPDVIIQKPAGSTLVVLDVELSQSLATRDEIQMVLRDMQAVELFSWNARTTGNGRVSAAFDSQKLPDGKVWLEMADGSGPVVDRRLLEFLP